MASWQQAYPRFRRILLVLATVCLLALLSGRAILFSVVRNSLTDYLAREHHLALSGMELGGSLVADLHLAKVRLARTEATTPLRELSLDSLRLEYSLLDLFRGRDAFLAGSRITLRGATAVVDLAGESGADSIVALPPLFLPPVLPRFTASDLSLTLVRGRYQAGFGQCAVSIGSALPGQGQPLVLESRAMIFSVNDEKGPSHAGRLEARYRPQSLRLQAIRLDGEALAASGEIIFPRQGTPASVTLTLGAWGGELAVQGRFASERNDLALRLSRLDLARFASSVLPAARQLRGKLSVDFTAGQDADGPSSSFSSAGQGTWQGREFAVKFSGTATANEFVLSHFAGVLGKNRLTLDGARFPTAAFADGEKQLPRTLRVADFSLSLADLPALWQLAGRDPAQLRALPAGHSLSLAGSIGEGRLVISRGAFLSRKNTLTLLRASLDLPVQGQSVYGMPIAGTVTFALRDLREIAVLLGEEALAGSLRGSISLSGTLREPVGSIKARGQELLILGMPLAMAELEARADRKQIAILTLSARNGEDLLAGGGVYSPQTRRFTALRGELRVGELARYQAIEKALGFAVKGFLHAEVSSARAGEQQGNLILRHAEINGLAVSRAEFELVTDRQELRFEKAFIDTPHGSLRLIGNAEADWPAQRLRARVRQLILTRGDATFRVQREWSFRVSWGERKSVEIADLLLHGEAGAIVVAGRLGESPADTLTVEVRNLAGGQWFATTLGPGYSLKGLDLTMVFRGEPGAARASVQATVAALACPQLNEPLRGELRLTYGPGGFRIERLALRGAHGHDLSLTGKIPYEPFSENGFLPGPLSVKGQIRLPDLRGMAGELPRQQTVTGELFADLDLSGSWQEPVGRVHLRAKELTVPQLRGLLPPEPFDLDGALVLRGTRLTLARAEFHSASCRGELSGEWRQLPALAEFFRLPPAELPGTLALQGALDLADIGWLVADSKTLRRLSGRVSSAFSLGGKAAAPIFSGAFTLSEGGLRFADPSFPALDGIVAKADFVDDSIRVQSMEGLLGGAPFSLAGTIVLAGEESRFDCRGKGKNLLVFRDADLKIRGDADLHLTGPLSRMTLAGRLVVTDGRYAKNIDFLSLFKGTARSRGGTGLQAFSLPDPPFRDMQLAIEVSADQPFLVRNNLARGAVRPAFLLTGTGEVPVLVGRLFVEPTRITLPAGRLTIESGVITFPENDPDRPIFDLAAKSRLAGYDITMQLQGTAEEPVISLSSQPPLSDEDLLMLVLTGRLPLASGRKSMAGMNVAVYLGKGLLANWFGNGETDESVLDRFDLEVGRQITSSGEDTLEAQFRVVEGLLLPGDRIFITSERDVYDNYNVGVKIVFRFK
ncbi:translocation/assembly module TamB domain-containing protein [Thiovibrio sp. JS02]